jgi:hypothetical protein
MRLLWGLLLGLWLTATVAGTPDHLLWIGKDQDALIMGEVERINSDKSRHVSVIASLAPSQWWSLKAGQRFNLRLPALSPLAETLTLQKGQKYLMSLREVDQHYELAWGIWPLTRDSQQLVDARLANYVPEYQFLLNTGARYPIPGFLFDETALHSDDPQIPTELVKNLPTEQLLQIYLTYPYLYVLQTAQPQTAFTQLQIRFKGLAELLKRPDTANATFKVLRTERLGSLAQLPSTTLNALSKRQSALVLVLAQADVLKELSAVDRLALRYMVNERVKQLHAAGLTHTPMATAYALLQQQLQQQ